MDCYSSTSLSSSSSSSACGQDEILEIIAATCHRETTNYRVDHWLESCCKTPQAYRRPRHAQPVDRACRTQMHAWCVKIVDICKLSREAVEITMSMVDRFVCTLEGTEARNDCLTYQLACLAALYITAKIHGSASICPEMLADLSEGLFTYNDIEDMEAILLNALQWRVNPPTSWDFIRMMMDLLTTSGQASLNQELVSVVRDLAFYQAELAVANDQFITVKASTIAYSAIMNALESMGAEIETLESLTCFLQKPLHLDATHVIQVQSNLYVTVKQQQAGDGRQHSKNTSSISSKFNCGIRQITALVNTSPRAVSFAH